MTLAAGKKLGRYEIRSQLGAGWMGEVYLALDTELDRTVAIKFFLKLWRGMSFPQILASLTTSPAERFGFSNRTGRIAPNKDADIVKIAGDPKMDIKALSNVKHTLRKGRVIYQ